MRQPLFGCVALGYSLSFSYPARHISRFPGMSFLERVVFGCSLSELAEFGQGWNWGAGTTGLKEAQGQVAVEGEAPFLLLTLGMNFMFFSKDLI